MASAPRTRNRNLPQRMIAVRKPKRTYFYYDAGTAAPKRYLPLGSDYADAMRRWAELEQGNAKAIAAKMVVWNDIADRYVREILPSKAERTQRDYLEHLVHLRAWFGDGPLAGIEPIHVRQYLDSRRHTPTQANREAAVFSLIWNFARSWGATDRSNPVAGVKRHVERARTTYITDQQYQALHQAAPQPLRDAMDLAYLTGQRPSDALKMRETDIRDGCLEIRQGKTDMPLRIEIVGKLAALLDRLRARKSGLKIHDTSLIVGAHGKAISQHWVRTMWVKARKEAGLPAELQFRDLRAKAVSDREDQTGNIRDAQALAGHTTVGMTEDYSRKRRGKKVRPVE